MVNYIFHCLNEKDRFNIVGKVEKSIQDNKNIIDIIKQGDCSNMLGWKCRGKHK